jgi:hypothetical protein
MKYHNRLQETGNFPSRAVIKVRRQGVSGQQAVDKVIEYLEKTLTVLEMDAKRYQKERNEEGMHVTELRRQWTENMIIWIETNV